MSDPSSLRHLWPLSPDVAFCNHGSFGACPHSVLDAQQALRDELESDPMGFFTERAEGLLDAARESVAAEIGADVDGLVFVPNATVGVNTMLRSLSLHRGDEILVTDHEYEAIRLAAEMVAHRAGATVTVAELGSRVQSPQHVVDAIRSAVTPATRYAVIDHITSPTGLVLPVTEIVGVLADLGVESIVDGAHGPGQVDLDIGSIGALAYTGNCHKWWCAPKGSAVLWVRDDVRDAVRPVVTSHGEGHRRPGRSVLHDRFDWLGTSDPTAYMTVPAAIRDVGAMVAGGWDEVRERNRRLALAARAALEEIGLEPVGPESMVGSMVTHFTGETVDAADVATIAVERTRQLFARHRVRLPFTWRRESGELMVRFSAHLHTSTNDVDRMVAALVAESDSW